MKNESKSESPLIGERSAEEMLKDFIRKETEYLQSCNPTNELGEITGNDFAAGVVRGMNKVLEEYASQFKAKEDSLPTVEYFEPDRGKYQENRYTFDQMMDFVKWYSGMDHSKVVAAYVRYIREVKPERKKPE